MSIDVGRRRFVRMTLLAQVSGLTLACGKKPAPPAPEQEFKFETTEAEASAKVGSWYFDVAPKEVTVPALVAALRSAHPDLFSLEPAELPVALREAVQRDFESDDVVNLDGWILSRSEARIAAFINLSTRT